MSEQRSQTGETLSIGWLERLRSRFMRARPETVAAMRQRLAEYQSLRAGIPLRVGDHDYRLFTEPQPTPTDPSEFWLFAETSYLDKYGDGMRKVDRVVRVNCDNRVKASETVLPSDAISPLRYVEPAFSQHRALEMIWAVDAALATANVTDSVDGQSLEA